MTGMIDTKQIELHFEKANMAAETVDRGKGLIVLGVITAGKSLLEAKEIVPHGEWAVWLAKHWDHSQSLAGKYMKIANSEHVPNLKDAKSMREALSLAIISDDVDEVDQPVVPRAERKAGRVQVQEVGQTVVQADHSVDATKMVDENAVKAEPKTNTKHSPATAKAKEADRPASMKVTPVIIDEPKQWPEVSLEDLINGVIKKLEHEKQKKAAAKTLRKLADTLDPPTKFAKPTVEDVAEYCRERKNNIDAETFVAHYAANGWKLANGNKLNDWKSAVITWEKRNDSGNKQAGRAIAGSGRIKPDAIDESAITWK